MVLVSIIVGIVAALISNNANRQKSISTAEIQSSLTGIPQHQNMLGSKNAAIRIMEFADLNCPACQEFHRETYSSLIAKYIGPGKASWRLQLIGLLGQDSRQAALQAYQAGQQNMMFQYSLAYYFQGASAAQHFPGINPAHISSSQNQAQLNLAKSEELARKMKVTETPSLFISRNGSSWQRMKLPSLSLKNLESSINKW